MLSVKRRHRSIKDSLPRHPAPCLASAIYLADPHLGLRFISHPFLWQSVSNKHPHISNSQLHCEHYFLFVRYELNYEYANDDTLGMCISHRYKIFSLWDAT